MEQELENKEKLERYLVKEIRQHQWAARTKMCVIHFLYFTAIICFGLALLQTENKILPKELHSIIIILPAVIMLIANTFKYDEKAKWNKLKQRKLEGLQRKLIFENVAAEEISKEITIELEKLDSMKVELEKPITK